MTIPTTDDLIRRLTGDDPEEAIPDALVHLILEAAEAKKRQIAMDDDLGEMG